MKHAMILIVFIFSVFLITPACSESSEDTGDTGKTGEVGDTGETEDADDTGHTGDPQSQIVGKWIGFFGEVITGPNDAPCDSIFFDFDNEGNILILSFLGGEPAAGHKGTYSFEDNKLLLSLTHDWAEKKDEELFLNWEEALWEAPIYAEVTSDGKVLKAGPSETEAWQVNKIELSDPDNVFMGNWIDNTTNGLFQISAPANYDYEEQSYNESGTLKQFIFIDDVTYFLSNTTYSSGVNGGTACDAYYVGSVALNEKEDEMTLGYGDNEVVYKRTGEN